MDLKKLAVVILVSLFPSGLLFAKEEVQLNRFIIGEVNRIESGLATLETDEGIERHFSLKKAEEKGVEGLAVGDRLFLQVSEGDLIVDIGRVSEKGVIEGRKERRWVLGKVVTYMPDTNELTIRLPNEKEITYRLAEVLANKVARVKMGSLVKLEIDEKEKLVHDLVISR